MLAWRSLSGDDQNIGKNAMQSGKCKMKQNVALQFTLCILPFSSCSATRAAQRFTMGQRGVAGAGLSEAKEDPVDLRVTSLGASLPMVAPTLIR